MYIYFSLQTIQKKKFFQKKFFSLSVVFSSEETSFNHLLQSCLSHHITHYKLQFNYNPHHKAIHPHHVSEWAPIQSAFKFRLKKILSLAGIFTLDLWGTKPMCYQLSYPGLGSSKKSYNSAFRHFIDIHPSQEVKEEKENDFFSKMGQKMFNKTGMSSKFTFK